MHILAVIPARSGSKKVVNKNIRLINGIPLFAYSILHAHHSDLINRIIVSTDSIKYRNIAKKYNAEVPFLRPDNISGDYSTDFEVFKHLLSWLKKNENYVPDILVHLRPTYPYRKAEDIDLMIKMLIENDVDAVRSIAPAKENPFKMWLLEENNTIKPLISKVYKINEPYNSPRQLLPTPYIQNASIDVLWSKTVLVKGSMTGKKILGYVMNHNYDIDNESELKEIRKIMKNEKNVLF